MTLRSRDLSSMDRRLADPEGGDGVGEPPRSCYPRAWPDVGRGGGARQPSRQMATIGRLWLGAAHLGLRFARRWWPHHNKRSESAQHP